MSEQSPDFKQPASSELPLEAWLKDLSVAAERVGNPERFLRAAILGFSHMPWIKGVTWRSPRSRDALGELSVHATSFTHLGVELVFATETPLEQAIQLNLRLLTELIGYVYMAKLREQEMQANAYTQAVYETGSRLVHDVKNLLQSLKGLCAAAEQSTPEQASALQQLMQRQLPELARRLEETLGRLKTPAKKAEKRQIPAYEWWQAFRDRFAQDDLVLEIDDPDSTLWLPQELFDSVAENLVQNALRKRQTTPDMRIRVVLVTKSLPSLTVCDSGRAADEGVVRKLFQAPVSAHEGMGIGLYQAAKQALEWGYRLVLSNNRDGNVCFTLWQETT